MARTGRPPKKPALKVVKGDFGKGKKAAVDSKKAGKKNLPPDAPECPKHLDSVEKKIWAQLISVLDKIGTLQRCDEGSLSAYCTTYARYQEAKQEVRENGMFYWTEGRQGRHRKLNPAVGVEERCEKILKSLAQEFGMTPASRKAMGYDLSQLQLPFDDAPKHDPTSGLLT